MLKKITARFPNSYILVADDYVVNQELAKEMLELMKCKVDVSENGRETVDMHRKNRYDLIFMDVQMPELDGYEATRQIREMEGEMCHTPIIAITANALTGDREKCLQSGMDDYISKPIRGETLEEILTQHLVKKGD